MTSLNDVILQLNQSAGIGIFRNKDRRIVNAKPHHPSTIYILDALAKAGVKKIRVNQHGLK